MQWWSLVENTGIQTQSLNKCESACMCVYVLCTRKREWAMPYIDNEASIGQCNLIPIPHPRSRQNSLRVGWLKVLKNTACNLACSSNWFLHGSPNKPRQPKNNTRKNKHPCTYSIKVGQLLPTLWLQGTVEGVAMQHLSHLFRKKYRKKDDFLCGVCELQEINGGGRCSNNIFMLWP